MEQLNGFDAFFLQSELENAPQHITHIYIYDPSTSRQSVVRFKEILANYEQRLNHAPIFKRQLVEVPLELDNPYWVESPDFNIEYHVRHVALPKPGDWRQLCILMARLHSQRLDLSKPMWQVYVIEGLDGVEGMPPGAFAIMTKMHHAMVDGKAALEMLEIVHDGDASASHEETAPVELEPAPDRLSLLKNAGINALTQPMRFFSKGRRIASALHKKNEYKKAHPELELKQTAKTLFNMGITSPHRVWGAGAFAIKDFIAIKSTVEKATLNDVVLCITSYAVEQYLEHHRSPISESLISGMAVDIRSLTDYDDGSNHATFLPLRVHSKTEGPIQRLAAIRDESLLRKEALKMSGGADTMRDVFDALPSGLLNLSFQFVDRFDLLNLAQMGFHYATTNIPGPRSDRYMVGAKVINSFGMAPLVGSTGLAFVISSYCDNITISFTCCRDTVSDPDYFEQCIYDAVNQVLDAASNQSTPIAYESVSSSSIKQTSSANG